MPLKATAMDFGEWHNLICAKSDFDQLRDFSQQTLKIALCYHAAMFLHYKRLI